MMSRRQRSLATASFGFTLVELIVAIAVIGVLMSLLLCGVQASRDAARRAQCANNLRNQVLSLQNFCATFQSFPAGRVISKGTEYSWCFEVLPYMDQGALAAQFDRTKPWSAGQNAALADTSLRIYRCPGALKKGPGKTDYGGIMGSTLSDVSVDLIGFYNGILIEAGKPGGRPDAVRLGEVSDGTSNTIAIAESCDRGAAELARWVSGLNCFSHENGQVNGQRGDSIFSNHLGGAYAAFADGKVQFLSSSTALNVLGAICTRNGGETVTDY